MSKGNWNMPSRRARAAKRRYAAERSQFSVFLNVPYDRRFERLYLAYISAVSAFGLVPRAAIEIPGGRRRLERILDLIGSCHYSIHDLSRVELDKRPPSTPRFNMPFELGIAVALAHTRRSPHYWFVCERQDFRLAKSLSDLNGTDPYIHEGRITRLFGQICNMFSRSERQPTVAQMRRIYRTLRRELPTLLRESGARSAFEARVFKDLCILANVVR